MLVTRWGEQLTCVRYADGSVLTEFPVIAWWLAKSNPESGLLPTDFEGETRCLEPGIYGSFVVQRGATLRPTDPLPDKRSATQSFAAQSSARPAKPLHP